MDLNRFAFVFAQVIHDAFVAQGLLRFAGVAAVQDEPMVGVEQEFFGHEAHKFVFYFAYVFARGEIHAVGYTENMGIHSHGRLAEGGVEYDVGGFAAGARLAPRPRATSSLSSRLLTAIHNILKLTSYLGYFNP